MEHRFGRKSPGQLARLIDVDPSTVRRWVDAALAEERSPIDPSEITQHPLTRRIFIGGREVTRIVELVRIGPHSK